MRFRRTCDSVQHLAEQIRQARLDGRPLQLGVYISLVGDSKLTDLLGHSTSQFRRDSLEKVVKHLEPAGLDITTQSGTWTRHDRFRIDLRGNGDAADPGDDVGEESAARGCRATPCVEMPDPFWPTALGLERGRELDFLS